MKHVIACMRVLCPISDETVKELESLVVKCNYPKRYQLIKENIFCRYAYFIEKGMTRSFWLVDGEEITTSFSCEGGIVFSMDELYYNKKSEEFVETLEDVEVYRIELTDLRRLFETNLEFCNWGESYIRMNTEGCTEVIRKGLHFLPDSGMKSSRNSFRMFAREPI